MSKPRYAAKPRARKHLVPFCDAQEAWFWFMRSAKARIDGARFDEAASDLGRPCDPDDIYRFVMALRRRRVLTDAHLKVLADYGWCEVPPDARVREEQWALRLWDEALDRLTTPLAARGIVEVELDDPEITT